LVEALAALGITIRVGLHTGEVELAGDDVGGLAVHIAARVMAAAEQGGILVSGTVRDLVTGSGIEFEPRGEHRLKGVPESWPLYEAKCVP
jgi:class 3 adenylate cyclase